MTALAIAALVALALAGYLAALETVLSRLTLVRALRLEDEELPGAPALLWLAEHRITAQGVVLVASVVARVATAALAVVIGQRALDGVLGIVVAVAIALLVILLVAEVVPRTVALRHLESTALKLAGSSRMLVRALAPVANSVVSVGRALVPRRHEVSGPYASDDELRQLGNDADEHDEELEPDERAMIRSIFELADTRAREIMTPRPDMAVVSDEAALDDVVAIVTERGFSRLPVHDAGDSERFVGVVYAKDLLERVASGGNGGGWRDLVREASLVPESKRVDDLLRELQAAAVHLALVVDEYGAIVGLVTIEDILEEIVGEIVDEHDQEEALVEVLDDGVLRVDARLGVDDLNELLGATLPEEGWDTVGGLVYATLGRVPVDGETLDLDGFTLTVESVQGHRVGKVLIVRSTGADGPSDPGPGSAPGDEARA